MDDNKMAPTPNQVAQFLFNLDVISYYLSDDDIMKMFRNGRHILEKHGNPMNIHKVFKTTDHETALKLATEISRIFSMVTDDVADSISHAIELRRKAGWK